jgi:EAL domain-containing protein (putative c-di-GMP-specific phosphodiesterase class I)
MSDALGFQVIAEGVETDTQFDMLREYGCQLFQGFLFSKPVAVEEVDAILKVNHLLFAEKLPT